MAQIINKIVRSEYPPRDTRVLWLDTTDNSLKTFTSGGWNKVKSEDDYIQINLDAIIKRITNLEAAIDEISYVERV